MMKRLTKGLKATHQLAPDFGSLLFSYALLPLIILAGFGLYLIIAYDYLLPFLTVLVVSMMIFLAGLAWYRYWQSQAMLATACPEALVEPSPDWADGDQAIWKSLNSKIIALLEQRSDWADLQEHALVIFSETARYYDKKELSFTLPEMLKMTEEVSRRYRQVLLTHVPAIERTPVSLIKSVYDNSESINKAVVIGQQAFNVYRILRLATPQGWISELRGQIQTMFFSEVSDNLQYKLKQALLQDVVAVAIDLYSGRFRYPNEELPPSAVTALDPLRVCVIGQVSAGKSSVVNALLRESRAEIDALPATDGKTIYDCSLDGMELLQLVDLPGLNGNAKRENTIFAEIKTANVILWVLKANQPARALDSEFKKKLDTFYQQPENRSRKRPVIIALLTQVDNLKPVSQWQPPYDLDQDTSAKADTIRTAMAYNQNILQPDRLIPVSFSAEREPFNLVKLEATLDEYFQKGIQVQLNQRRLVAGASFSLGAQLGRIYQSGHSLFQLLKN